MFKTSGEGAEEVEERSKLLHVHGHVRKLEKYVQETQLRLGPWPGNGPFFDLWMARWWIPSMLLC